MAANVPICALKSIDKAKGDFFTCLLEGVRNCLPSVNRVFFMAPPYAQGSHLLKNQLVLKMRGRSSSRPYQIVRNCTCVISGPPDIIRLRREFSRRDRKARGSMPIVYEG